MNEIKKELFWQFDSLNLLDLKINLPLSFPVIKVKKKILLFVETKLNGMSMICSQNILYS